MTKNEYIVQCPRCGAEFPEREKFCPHCDTPNRKMICRSCGAQINASERVCTVTSTFPLFTRMLMHSIFFPPVIYYRTVVLKINMVL